MAERLLSLERTALERPYFDRNCLGKLTLSSEGQKACVGCGLAKARKTAPHDAEQDRSPTPSPETHFDLKHSSNFAGR